MVMKKWTKKEEDFLRESSSFYTLKQLAVHLDRGTRGVDHKIREWGLSYINEMTTPEFKQRASDKQKAYAVEFGIPGYSKWQITDEGRQCAYSGEGNCGHAFLPWSDFSKGADARGHKGTCRTCDGVRHQNIPLEERREKNLVRTLRQYNLTVDQYQTMVSRFEGSCWLCRKPETKIDIHTGEIQRFKVDHDHACCPGTKSCGKCVRGLLCDHCNGNVMRCVDKVGLDSITNYVILGYVNIV